MLTELNPQHVTSAFNRAAHTYDDAAFIQQEIGKRLLAKLDLMRLQPEVIVDLGAGTGFCSELLRERFPNSTLIALDSAAQMLKRCQQRNKADHLICADAQNLPLAPASVDLVVSNLTFHWCSDFYKALLTARTLLKPDGLLLFSTKGPDTLKELRQSFATVDDQPHTMAFMDMHHWGDALMRAQFLDPVVEMEQLTLNYPSVAAIVADLRACGTWNLNPNRTKGLLSRNKWTQFLQAYEQFKTADASYPVTVEVIYGHGWGRVSRPRD